MTRQGQTVDLKATVSFTHKACDEAPVNTSFYAKGAEIVTQSDWVRIDSISFYKKLSVRIKNTNALVTAVLIKHTQNKTSQVKLAADR